MPHFEPERLVASTTVFDMEGGFILLRLLGMMQMSTKDEGLLRSLRGDHGDLHKFLRGIRNCFKFAFREATQ